MSLPPITAAGTARRYDLDWLRAIAFGLLIFYHVGMFYVTWGWHVKSSYAGPVAEPLMLTVNPWRLALLFFISGVAVRFASDKAKSPLHFAGSRAFSLGIPIIFGMAIVVAPQTYFQLRQAGLIEPGFGDFYGAYIDPEQQPWSVTTPTWNHLWYVVYLLAYVILLAPLLPLLRRAAEGPMGRALGWISAHPLRLIGVIALPFVGFEYLLTPRFPTTHDLVSDWANHAHRLTIFLLGYFVAKHPGFWRGVHRTLPAALTLLGLLWVYRMGIEQYWPALRETAWRAPVSHSWSATSVLYAWAAILSLLGLAQRYLNRPSRLLRYLTSAVFCYYLVHQTITVAAGYWLTEYTKLGPVLEPIAVIAATIAGCALSFELVRRIPLLRIAFGIRQR